MWMFGSFFILLGAAVYSTQASTLQQEENLALKGQPVQSSTNFGWVAANAIDMRPSTCTHTATSTNPWWRLDLLDSYYISEVIITNRGDCCGSRLDGAEIHIGNSLDNNGNNNPRCALLYGVGLGQSVSMSCGDMWGRYVNVFIPGSLKIVTLCEVQVYMTVNKVIMRILLVSSVDIAEPAAGDQALNQLQTVLMSKGLSDFILSWIKLPQKVKTRAKQGPCIKKYN